MASAERREHLKQYILGCVRDNALSWADLAKPDRFLRVLSLDIKIVLKDLGREGFTGLLQMGAVALAGMAASAVKGK